MNYCKHKKYIFFNQKYDRHLNQHVLEIFIQVQGKNLKNLNNLKKIYSTTTKALIHLTGVLLTEIPQDVILLDII